MCIKFLKSAKTPSRLEQKLKYLPRYPAAGRMRVRRLVAHILPGQLPCQLPEPAALPPELRPARLLRLIVTVEALQFRSLVHPIPLQRFRKNFCSQVAPSEPPNRPRLGKPGITTSCALNLTSLPRACTLSDQLRDPSLTQGALSITQSLLADGAPAGDHLRSVRTPGIFGRCPPHLGFLKNFVLSYDLK